MRPFLCLLLLPVFLWAKAPLVAVSDLNPRAISASDASIITDRLRSELLQTGKVRVLERTEMDKILKEQAFQNSGACDQSQCAVEMGKLLSVDRMMVGSVGRIGELYTLSARVLDVRTGEVLFTATQDELGSLENLLVTTVPVVAARLAEGMDKPGGSKPEGFGDLYVTLEDSSASLVLDGKPVQGRSPFSIEHVATGNHRLVARSGDRIGTVQVELSKDDLQRIWIPLSQGCTPTKFFTEPAGALVLLDDETGLAWEKGDSPLKLDSLPVGPHRVTFRKAGYKDTSIAFLAVLDKPGTVRVRLTPVGTLVLDPAPQAAVRLVRGHDTLVVPGLARIDLAPGTWQVTLQDRAWEPLSETVRIEQGRDDTLRPRRHFARIEVNANHPAQVWVDDRPRGIAPVTADSLEPGRHKVLLRATGQLDLLQELSLDAGQTQILDAQMESRYAWLRLHSPVVAHVELDGRPAGTTATPPLHLNSHPSEQLLWNSDTLAPGTHRLRVTADRRIPWDAVVELAPGSTMTYRAELPLTPEELAHQRGKALLGKRVALGALTAGAGSLTALFSYWWQHHASSARDIQAQYDAARTDFPAYKARYDSQRQAANSNLIRAGISGAVTALAAAGLGLSWSY